MDEYWHNTSFYSAIRTIPYETLYGRPPPLHLSYLPGESTSADVDNTLINKELKLQLLQYHLLRAQLRMKQQNDSHMSDRNFEVGDWVYFKTQPYRKLSIATQPFHKLAAKYYGSFYIIKKVGVAYTLLFSLSVKLYHCVCVIKEML